MNNQSRRYAGAEWIERAIKPPSMSPLGKKVADFLGDLYLGIYHMNSTSLAKVDWSHDFYIEVTLYGTMSTVDNNLLTRLVVMAHDRMLRVELRGIGPNYMKAVFHQRKFRDRDADGARLHNWCPTIEHHLEMIARGDREVI